MAQSNDDYEFSLFPFMGVLAGVIGTLVLVISGLAIIGMSQSTVTVSLEGNPQDQEPVCVECGDNQVIIHRKDGRQIIETFSENPDEIRPLLTELARNRDTQYLVLLVRPDAIATFEEVELIVKKFELKYSYDALLREEEFQFSG